MGRRMNGRGAWPERLRCRHARPFRLGWRLPLSRVSRGDDTARRAGAASDGEDDFGGVRRDGRCELGAHLGTGGVDAAGFHPSAFVGRRGWRRVLVGGEGAIEITATSAPAPANGPAATPFRTGASRPRIRRWTPRRALGRRGGRGGRQRPPGLRVPQRTRPRGPSSP